ncbi:flavoprotein [Streptomyces sp. NPDC020681]|uniref:flavoprotein n=1 Tax=Streptomyces sp. NPDC020681 TaxID=3365083 RepID=UPI00379F50B5
MHPVVHLVGCGTRPTEDLPDFASALRAAGWDPCIVPSPVGRRFLDIDRVKQCSGQAVRWDFDPDDPVALPQADAVVVAPATFNTITKLAAGIADTLALAVTAEAVGAHVTSATAPPPCSPAALPVRSRSSRRAVVDGKPCLKARRRRHRRSHSGLGAVMWPPSKNQRRGGGHGRRALVQYVQSYVASFLRSKFPVEA